MGTQFNGRQALLVALLLASSTASAESWELRPAAGDVPGSAEIEAGRIEDAISILLLELETYTSGTHLAVIENLCVAYAMNLEYDVAMRYCDRAARHSMASASTLNNRGVLRAVMNDHRGAMQDFRRAGCMRSCDPEGDCETESVRAMVRRNLARVKLRDASSFHEAVLFQPRV